MRFSIFLLLLFYTIDAQSQDAYKIRKGLEKNSILKDYPARSIGPVVQGGRVTDIEVDPTNATTYYVGYASGGIFKTVNNGISFEPVFDDQGALGIGDLAISRSNPQVLYAGTGEKNSSRSSYAGSGVYRSDDGGKTWVSAGLSDTQHISRILVHPQDPDRLWVAAIGSLYSNNKQRGIFYSENGGQSWKNTLYINDSTGVIDLIINPDNPDELWASSWERTRSAGDFKGDGPGSSIYHSTDGGMSWKKAVKGFPQGKGAGRIGLAVCPTEPARLYAFLDNQRDKPEENEGKEKEDLTPKDFEEMDVKEIIALEDKKLEGFLRREGYPEKYTAKKVKKDLQSGKYKPLDIAEYFGDADEELFEADVIGAELYRSDNSGEDWYKVNSYPLEGVYFTYGYYFGEVRVAPDNADEVYVFGVPFLASYDGGKTYSRIDTLGNVHADQQALWIDPGNSDHLRLGNDGGLYESYDGGAHWIHINNTAVGQFYTVNVDMEKPYNVYGGLQDNGSLRGASTSVPNQSPSWQQLFGGDGMFVTPDPRNSDIVYTGFQFGNYYRINLKTGDRDKITPSHDIGDPKLRWNWRTPLLISPHNPDILYMGAQRVYRTMDGGKDWEPVSDDLTRNLPQGNVPYSTISTMMESPDAFGHMLVGTDDGLVQVHDKTGWKNISEGLPKGKWVSYVFISPHNPETYFVTLNGYREDDFTTYIYRSDDNGSHWTSLKNNLPDVVVNVLIQDPVEKDLLYLGTDHGLYMSLNGGAEWSYISSVPNVAVYDLIVQPRENELVVATHGRSMYVMDVKPLQSIEDHLNQTAIFADSTMRWSDRWGKKRYEYLPPFYPKWEISYYLPKAGTVKFEMLNDDEKVLSSWMEQGNKGFNYTHWDLRKKTGKEVNTKKKDAEDARYVDKGDYTLKMSFNDTPVKQKLKIK